MSVEEDGPTLYTLEPEGAWPDTAIEDVIFANLPSGVHVEHLRGNIGNAGEGRSLADIPDEICARVQGLFMFRHYLTAQDIARFPKLRVVVRMGVGYDRLDRVELAKRGVKVCNVPDYGTAEVADHAIALALSMRRGILLHHDTWPTLPLGTPLPWVPQRQPPLIQRPSTRVFGVLGLGRIGTAAALRAKAFGWQVIFYDPYLPNGVDRALGIERVKTIDGLFQRSNTLSVHLPLTPITKNIVNERLLRLMPPGAVVVNTSRGATLDLDALEKVLRDGTLAGAALDVLPQEPPPRPLHPLITAYQAREEWLRGRLVITPHIAFFSPDSWDDIRANSAWTMREVLCEGLETNVIKPEDF